MTVGRERSAGGRAPIGATEPRGASSDRSVRDPLLPAVVWPKLRLSRGAGRGRRVARVLSLLVGVAIAFGIHEVALWFLRLCYDVEVVGPLLCRRLLDIVLLVLLGVLLLSNVISALASFFLARDLDLLLVAPVVPRTLFSARLGEQLLQSSWMVLAFGVPVLLAFARVCGSSQTYLAFAIALPPLLAIPAAVAAAVTLLLVRFLPAARARNLVVALMLVGFVALYLLVRLMRPERLLDPEGFASMVTFLASFAAPSGSWLPSHQATVVIGSTFRDDVGAGSAPLALAALWTGAGVCYTVASALFRWLHARAYSRSQQAHVGGALSRLWARTRGRQDGSVASSQADHEQPRARATARRSADWGRLVGAIVRRGPGRELLIKDFKLLIRDASQWSQLVLLLGLVFVYLYNFRHFRELGDSGLIGPLALFLLGLGLSGFVTAAVGVRFAYPLISMEGKLLWLLCTAPLARRQILRAKLMATLLPLVVVAEVMSIVSSRILGMEGPLVLLGGVVAAATALVVAAIAAGVGAILPNYSAESAAKVASSFGGLVCMTAAVAAALVLVGWVIYPAYALYYHRAVHWEALVGCAIGGVATVLFATWLPLRLGTRALERYEP